MLSTMESSASEIIGSPTFKYVGGDLSVDFVNTVGGWVHRPGSDGQTGYRDVELRDKFGGYADILAWAEGAGVIKIDESRRLAALAKRFPLAADELVDRAIRLRRAIYRIFLAKGRDRASFVSDLSVLNSELAAARARQRLVANHAGFELDWQHEDSLDRVLWPVAVSAVSLVTTGDLSRLRQCGGPDCGWMFLDNSRNRSRTWCNMKDCGNLAKVRRFRQRQKPEA
jgi:predicted RNA-binding Zn ribbon-like protein